MKFFYKYQEHNSLIQTIPGQKPNIILCSQDNNKTNNIHYNFPPFDSKIEYLQSSGTQYIDTGINYDFSNKISIDVDIIPINSNRSIIISNYCDGNASSISCELGGTSNSHAIQPRFYISLTSKTNTSDTWQNALTLNTSYQISYEYNKSNGQKIFISNGNTSTLTYTGTKYGTTKNLLLFSDHRANKSAIANGLIIKKLKIYKNAQIVRDFISVRIGTIGYLYDNVSEQLFGNNGTGSFTLGPDIN